MRYQKIIRVPERVNFTVNFLLAGVLCFAALEASAVAAPGGLDRAFGDDGVVTTWFGGGDDDAWSVAIQPDGKIVVAGFGPPGGGFKAFEIARYNPDGSLDTTFDGDGMVTTAYGVPGLSQDFAFAVALQPDGKIVAAGNHAVTGGDWDFFVVRYNPDGSLDPSFDHDGKVTTSIGAEIDQGKSIAIQPDGKIVVAGISDSLPAHTGDFALVRYNPDGSLDSTFSFDGIVTTPIGSNNFSDLAFSVAVQSDGKIVEAGSCNNGDFALARYNQDGSLDNSFDGDGKVITTIGSGCPVFICSTGQSLAIQADGKMVVVGTTFDGGPDTGTFTVVRYRPNGSLDTSFSSDGFVTTRVGRSDGIPFSVAIQSDSKILAAGHDDADYDFALVRYDADGSLDTTFGGGDGITTVALSDYADQAHGMALDSQGRAVVVGAGQTYGSPQKFELARFLLMGTTTADFDGDGRSDLSVFRPGDSVWYLNRSRDGFAAVQFGNSSDRITPADFDGDGITDVAVYRPETGAWYWLNSSNGAFNARQFGVAKDLPTPADYDGDGRADISVFRPSDGTWYRLNSSDGSFYAVQFGASDDKPTTGDFDGDGKADLAVWRPSNRIWYRLNSSDGQFVAVGFGLADDLVTPADFDSDGKTDIAVYRPSNGTWYWLNSSNGVFNAVPFGTADDIPSAADYDGDGKADISVFRPSDGVWYRLNSSNGSFVAIQFGTSGDRPTPSAFRY